MNDLAKDIALAEVSKEASEVGANSEKPFSLNCSRQMVSWLLEQNISLAFSTYSSGKIMMLGSNQEGQLSLFERSFERPMGLWANEQSLLMTSQFQILKFQNILPEGQLNDGYDKLFVPQITNITGDLDIHDISVDSEDRPVFVNSLFSCLAQPSEIHSFKPIWKPKFISKLQPEDRCHLNGLAMKDGKPAFVSALAESDIQDGWRDHRAEGGIIIDLESDEIICRGLSMPHSPRWHQGRLWLGNSGTGEFGYIDTESGRFEPVTFCPGFIRGLSLVGDFAILGLSEIRDEKNFGGLKLSERLNKENVKARCGLVVVDLKTGALVHSIYLEGRINELYDVVVLPNTRRPSLVGFRNDQIRRVISLEENL